jgi:hypothetical protein
VDGSVQTVTFWQRQNEAAAVSSGDSAVHRVLLSSMGSIFRDSSRLMGSDE